MGHLPSCAVMQALEHHTIIMLKGALPSHGVVERHKLWNACIGFTILRPCHRTYRMPSQHQQGSHSELALAVEEAWDMLEHAYMGVHGRSVTSIDNHLQIFTLDVLDFLVLLNILPIIEINVLNALAAPL